MENSGLNISPSKFDSTSVQKLKYDIQRAIQHLQSLEAQKSKDNSYQLEQKIESVKQNLQSKINNSLQTQVSQSSELIEQSLDNFNIIFDEIMRNSQQALDVSHQNRLRSHDFEIEKVHKKQSSPISKLLYSKDFKTIYNIFIAILVNLGVAVIAEDLLNTNEFMGYQMLLYNFGQYENVIIIWILMFFVSFYSVLLVNLFANGLPGYIVLTLHSVVQAAHILFACFTSLKLQLPISSSIIVLCEAFRFSMKAHSYIREKLLHGDKLNKFRQFIPQHILDKGMTLDQLKLPEITIKSLPIEIKQFCFFLFAPTLIYRDQYPMIEKKIRWNNLGAQFFNFFGVIIYTTVIFKAFCVPLFREAAVNVNNIHVLIVCWIKCMLPATMVFMLLFFGVMHAWFNIWAELLQFGDRKIYDDWWNSTNFNTFYRKVCLILYEWVYSYIYIDLMRFSNGKVGPRMARVIVYIISGSVCELILDLALGFPYLALFLIITVPGSFAMAMSMKSSDIYNVIIWALLIMTNGAIMVLYSVEYYYRLQKENGGCDFLGIVPWWICNLDISRAIQ